MTSLNAVIVHLRKSGKVLGPCCFSLCVYAVIRTAYFLV